MAGKLLRADDFSDPTHGLFPDHQSGVIRQLVAGKTAEIPWEWQYDAGSLLVKVHGPYPDNNTRMIFGARPTSADKIAEDDFAIEVKAEATQSAPQAVYGIEFATDDDTTRFTVVPETGSYGLYSYNERRYLSQARSSSVLHGQPNVLRMEFHSDLVRLLANGKEIESGSYPSFKARSGVARLTAYMDSAPADQEVDVRFTDFKVMALDAPASSASPRPYPTSRPVTPTPAPPPALVTPVPGATPRPTVVAAPLPLTFEDARSGVRLSYPQNWRRMDNPPNGLVAFTSPDQNLVEIFTLPMPGVTPDQLDEVTLKMLQTVFPGVKIISVVPTVLGTSRAQQTVFSGTFGGRNMVGWAVNTIKSGRGYLFFYVAQPSLAADDTPTAAAMLKTFVIDSPKQPVL